ncbi:hypothetical protein VTN31DRAFT_7100 [Thermomyces dupontii]|uniref:uncharacterized protein n=1 Tax=Talaromyces thermophilus TaxID=28565 RepID=UPI0037434146
MLEAELPPEDAPNPGKSQKGSDNNLPPTSHTLLDLLIAMSIYLPRSAFGDLFSLASKVLNRQGIDQQLIKKAYKLIPRLATTETGREALAQRNGELQALILATADKTPSPARRDRLLAIHELVTHLPTSDLHFIPSIMSEVVLGCKEANEKARTAAFELLIHLAKRITDPERNPPGTIIRNPLVPHMPSDAPDAPATLEEFFTMASAGLAGSTPHMVAATVTALSRLFFEYHRDLAPNVSSDLVQTLELFLTSNNREIVRAVLGFVKVEVVVLPEDTLRQRLDGLVPKLMVWSKEHKGRLRSKVKGILDRLIRRYGAQLVENLVGEADRRLVVNVRKERERRKRKSKKHQTEQEQPTTTTTTKPGKRGSDFDRAMHDSDLSSENDSDMDISSDEENASEIEIDEHGQIKATGSSRRRRTHGNEQYIREENPESNPLDLLAPDALASISTTKPSHRFLNLKHKKKKTTTSSAQTDADGKLIINDDTVIPPKKKTKKNETGDEDVAMGNADDAGGSSGINAYIAAVSGPDALRRGQKGRLKIKQRHGHADEEDDDDDDGGREQMDIDGDELHAAKAKGSKLQFQAGKLKKAKPQRRGLGMTKGPAPATKTKGNNNNPASSKMDKKRKSGSGRGAIGKR